jgi:hypothetical protein
MFKLERKVKIFEDGASYESRITLGVLCVIQFILTLILFSLTGSLVHAAPASATFHFAFAPEAMSIATLISFAFAYRFDVFRYRIYIWTTNGLNIICTFTAAMLVSCRLGRSHNCNNKVRYLSIQTRYFLAHLVVKDYTSSNSLLSVYPDDSQEHYCREAQAVAVLFFFLLIIHIRSTFLTAPLTDPTPGSNIP